MLLIQQIDGIANHLKILRTKSSVGIVGEFNITHIFIVPGHKEDFLG